MIIRRIVLIGIAYFLLSGCSVKNENANLKSVFLEQLKNTHNNEDWFVPAKTAIAGLTAEQANLKDSTDNHSIGELVSHLIFWNERVLIAFNGNRTPDFDGNNEQTFKKFDINNWSQAMNKLDSIQTAWEQSVENSNEDQLRKWSGSITNLCSHNAYHTGQIIYIRKKNGWWTKPKQK